MDMLVSPMRFLRMDDVEFVALKACILFNPVARGLSSNSVMSILQTRRHIFRALQNYVRAKAPNDEDRIGDLTFFVLSPLQVILLFSCQNILWNLQIIDWKSCKDGVYEGCGSPSVLSYC